MANIGDIDTDENNKKSMNVLGTNMAEIPCFRRSFITGILGGLGCGVGYFLFTSNARRAPHIAFGSYLLITIGTWGVCRYNWSVDRFRERQIKKGLQTKVMVEGTDLEKKIKAEGGYKEV